MPRSGANHPRTSRPGGGTRVKGPYYGIKGAPKGRIGSIDREFEFYEFFHSQNLTNFSQKIVILQLIDV